MSQHFLIDRIYAQRHRFIARHPLLARTAAGTQLLRSVAHDSTRAVSISRQTPRFIPAAPESVVTPAVYSVPDITTGGHVHPPVSDISLNSAESPFVDVPPDASPRPQSPGRAETPAQSEGVNDAGPTWRSMAHLRSAPEPSALSPSSKLAAPQPDQPADGNIAPSVPHMDDDQVLRQPDQPSGVGVLPPNVSPRSQPPVRAEAPAHPAGADDSGSGQRSVAPSLSASPPLSIPIVPEPEQPTDADLAPPVPHMDDDQVLRQPDQPSGVGVPRTDDTPSPSQPPMRVGAPAQSVGADNSGSAQRSVAPSPPAPQPPAPQPPGAASAPSASQDVASMPALDQPGEDSTPPAPQTNADTVISPVKAVPAPPAPLTHPIAEHRTPPVELASSDVAERVDVPPSAEPQPTQSTSMPAAPPTKSRQHATRTTPEMLAQSSAQRQSMPKMPGAPWQGKHAQLTPAPGGEKLFHLRDDIDRSPEAWTARLFKRSTSQRATTAPAQTPTRLEQQSQQQFSAHTVQKDDVALSAPSVPTGVTWGATDSPQMHEPEPAAVPSQNVQSEPSAQLQRKETEQRSIPAALASPKRPAQARRMDRRSSDRSTGVPAPDTLFAPDRETDRSPAAWLARLRGDRLRPPHASAPPAPELPQPAVTAVDQTTTDQPPSLSESITPLVQHASEQPPAVPTSLPDTTRRFLRPLVGIDPAQVRFYHGAEADQTTSAHGADALTSGDAVVLSAGHMDESPETLGLLAHELTHVARQHVTRFVPP